MTGIPANQDRPSEAKSAKPYGHDSTKGAIERGHQHYAVIAGFLGWTFDAFDFFVLTFVIGDVAKSFGKSRPEIALTITLALAMRPLGALIFGVMADRVGRRLPLMLNIVWTPSFPSYPDWRTIIKLL